VRLQRLATRSCWFRSQHHHISAHSKVSWSPHCQSFIDVRWQHLHSGMLQHVKLPLRTK